MKLVCPFCNKEQEMEEKLWCLVCTWCRKVARYKNEYYGDNKDGDAKEVPKVRSRVSRRKNPRRA